MYWCTTEGAPSLKEPDKISQFGWYSLPEIQQFEKAGTLAPNLQPSALLPYLTHK